jgi:MoaA/NifB/PqqE/SkfB family radical SAM enzyme
MTDLTELCLEVTSTCHSHCNYCSNDYNFDVTISLDDCKKIIDDFVKMNGKTLELSGGEPLLHPDIMKIVAYAKQNGLEVRLYTSGNFCRKGIYGAITDEMANRLFNAGLDKIYFNLQGSHITHDRITGIRNGYNNVISGIKKTVGRGIYTGVHFVPTKMNYKDVQYVVSESEQLGVSEIEFLRLVLQGRAKYNREALLLSPEETEKLYASLEKAMESNKVKVKIGHPFTFKLTGHIDGGCPSGITTCLIKPTGEVSPCPAFKGNEKCDAGNVLKSSLKTVWTDSELFKKFRENCPKIPRCCL